MGAALAEATTSPRAMAATTAAPADHPTLPTTTTREETSARLTPATGTATTMAGPERTRDLPSIASRDKEVAQEDTTTAIDARAGTRAPLQPATTAQEMTGLTAAPWA